MNVTKVAHGLWGDATSQPGETKEGAGATTGLPFSQNELSPSQKDPQESKLRDLNMKVLGVESYPMSGNVNAK